MKSNAEFRKVVLMSNQEMNEGGEYLLYNTLDTHRKKWLSYLSVQS